MSDFVKGFQTNEGIKKYDYESLGNLPNLEQYISYNQQQLTEEQKAQVRENIGVTQGNNNPQIFVITANLENNTADYSSSEIRAALNSGSLPILLVNGEIAYLKTGKSSEYPIVFSTTSLDLTNGEISSNSIQVKEDKALVITTMTRQSVPEPVETDYGKVLSASAEGLMWIENFGGAPSAEGVEF